VALVKEFVLYAREGAHVVVSDQNRTSAERVAAEITKMGGGLWPSDGRAKRKRLSRLIEYSLKKWGRWMSWSAAPVCLDILTDGDS